MKYQLQLKYKNKIYIETIYASSLKNLFAFYRRYIHASINQIRQVVYPLTSADKIKIKKQLLKIKSRQRLSEKITIKNTKKQYAHFNIKNVKALDSVKLQVHLRKYLALSTQDDNDLFLVLVKSF